MSSNLDRVRFIFEASASILTSLPGVGPKRWQKIRAALFHPTSRVVFFRCAAVPDADDDLFVRVVSRKIRRKNLFPIHLTTFVLQFNCRSTTIVLQWPSVAFAVGDSDGLSAAA